MSGKAYYTQREVAEIFRVSQGTVIKWRELGYLEYFRPPGCSRVLYAADAIEEFRKNFTYRKEVMNTSKIKGRHNRRVASQKEWRI